MMHESQHISRSPHTGQIRVHSVDKNTYWLCMSDTEHGNDAESQGPSWLLLTCTEETCPVITKSIMLHGDFYGCIHGN